MEFNIENNQTDNKLSKEIRVIGIGGAGCNALNHMNNLGFENVDLIISNTDAQVLNKIQMQNKILLGKTLTCGNGAGFDISVGENATKEAEDEIKKLLEGTKMLFITAGLGKGTGTGGAHLIAKYAKEMNITTTAIVTFPFNYEGINRKETAKIGFDNLIQYVDSYIVIENQKIFELHKDATLINALQKSDDILAKATKSLIDIVYTTGLINVDLNDAINMLKNSGKCIISMGRSGNENRALEAITSALDNPLLSHNSIVGAQNVLINIIYGDNDITMQEQTIITDEIQKALKTEMFNSVFGFAFDETYGKDISVTLITSNFISEKNSNEITELEKESIIVEERKTYIIEDKIDIFEDQNNIKILKPDNNSIIENDIINSSEKKSQVSNQVINDNHTQNEIEFDFEEKQISDNEIVFNNSNIPKFDFEKNINDITDKVVDKNNSNNKDLEDDSINIETTSKIIIDKIDNSINNVLSSEDNYRNNQIKQNKDDIPLTPRISVNKNIMVDNIDRTNKINECLDTQQSEFKNIPSIKRTDEKFQPYENFDEMKETSPFKLTKKSNGENNINNDNSHINKISD